MSKLPNAPWEKIAIDFFGPLSTEKTLLVIIDLYTRFPVVEIMKTTNVNAVINHLERIFSMLGYLNPIIRNNSPPFSFYFLIDL